MDDYDILINNLNNMYCCSSKLGETYNNILQCVSSNAIDNISIYLHHIENSDDIYFKVFNDADPQYATKCCRIKLFKIKYKNKPDDDCLDNFVLSDDQKKIIIQMLQTPFDYGIYEEKEIYTPWEYAIRTYKHSGCNKKVRRLFNKYKNNMPDYTRL